MIHRCVCVYRLKLHMKQSFTFQRTSWLFQGMTEAFQNEVWLDSQNNHWQRMHRVCWQLQTTILRSASTIKFQDKIKWQLNKTCFFWETHKGECGFEGYFYDQEKGLWPECLNAVLSGHLTCFNSCHSCYLILQKVFRHAYTELETQEEESKGEYTLLNNGKSISPKLVLLILSDVINNFSAKGLLNFAWSQISTVTWRVTLPQKWRVGGSSQHCHQIPLSEQYQCAAIGTPWMLNYHCSKWLSPVRCNYESVKFSSHLWTIGIIINVIALGIKDLGMWNDKIQIAPPINRGRICIKTSDYNLEALRWSKFDIQLID